MNIVEFNFSNGNKIQAQIENSNEKIFRIFLEKRLKIVNQYIKATKDTVKECKRLNIVNRDDFDIFQINSMEVLINLLFELKNGLLQEFNDKSGNGCPHACIKSHYLKFVKYVNAYKNYVSKDMVKYLKTRGGEKEFKVEIKNQKIEVVTSVDTVRPYSLNRFLEYSVLSKNEDDSYAKPLFEDILSSSNLSAIKQSENERIYKEQYFENEKIPSENQNPPLNQILYGPPGTGKTYHTIDKALEILGENLASRHEKKAKFDEYVKNGQIVFTTFHQSYGYEEFVEGIKPIIDNDENSQELKYEIKNGVFKELCDKSLKNYISSIQNENETDLDKLIFEFANYINQNYLDKGNEFPLENKVNVKKILLNSKDEYRSFLLGGSIKSPQRLTIDVIKRDYLDFINGRILSFKDIKPKYDSQSDYHGNATYYFMFYKKLKEFEGLQNEKFKIKKDNLKPYIIIIDEINRGNVSKIFGELITLIEPSKRIGESEGLKVTLPYSGEKFGVPKNVYIVGTMNTADRSITSLDTALRRRFEFVEMMPDAEELEKSKYKDVNLKKLLEAINTRIEYLLDREKTIGHAFFIGVENLNNLKNVFQNKIIPLLQEYFYNDYALIDAVLNKNGMLEKQDINNNYLKNMTEIIESDKVIYKFSDSQKWDENTFKKIYE
ncbi:McrBC 5-methylcytosine restriction system, component McrB [Campylobacter lari]|uniref:McrBC 5-methylcytosine restriction system, component McrB n=1 Tax=Campylobacter lari TaxID=201 RepID=UPI00057ECBC3|nr:McrBC 5-methylcytosine restriction system, component McrB [Campylobacter lari]AJC88670.1 McrBC 5-methylcytosine restriction system, component McrB [Campylobacter lari subsp. concheus LMG 11760]EAK5847394.1 McrBC 5-methylcytosine restriction system, component McrB [Campylobacter lari]